MKNKNVQLALLSALLLAVIAAGAYLVLRTPAGSEPAGPSAQEESAAQRPAQMQSFDISGFRPATYRPVRQTEENAIPDWCAVGPLAQIICFADQPCVFSCRQGESEEDFSLDIVSMASGEVLRAYGPEEFYEEGYLCALSLDQEETLWAVYQGWDAERLTLAPCREGVTEADVFSLPAEMAPSAMAAWNGYFVLSGFDGETRLLDTSSGAAEVAATWKNVQSFCVDEDGNLYLLVQETDGRYASHFLTKYSLEQKAELWKTDLEELGYRVPTELSYTKGGGLLLSYSYEKKLVWADRQTGALQLLVDLEGDVAGLEDVWMDWTASCCCAVDGRNRLYLSRVDYDFSDGENRIFSRKLYVLEPDQVEVDPADMVTLTITAPYKVESVAAAARAYLREHPEVELVWDTQYISREELQKNAMEYKDQIALRLMTGEVGDLVMVTGSGLGTETMTGSDAFADLSGYLDSCPFREELPDNYLEALRAEDGAIRGLPLGIVPNCYVWNEDLLEELGIDPYTVTWSQLLDLALQWKEQGTDLSLEITEAGIGLYGSQEQMFQDILLANLYDAPRKGGSVRLDQPELRGLLEKFKELAGSTQLIRSDGDASRALIVSGQISSRISDRLHWTQNAAAQSGAALGYGPVPLGEGSRTRQGYAFCWAVSQRSENRQAACELLLYLAGSNVMTVESWYSYSDDTLPVNAAAQERWLDYFKSLFGQTPETASCEALFRQMQQAMDVPYARYDQITGWYQAVAEPLGQYITGALTLDEAMGQADGNWSRFLLD